MKYCEEHKVTFNRIIKHRVHAFVSQLLLWNDNVYGVEYDRESIDARLKRVGSFEKNNS